MASCGTQSAPSNMSENHYETLPDRGNNYVGLETMRFSRDQVVHHHPMLAQSPSVRVRKSSDHPDLELETKRIRLIMTIGLGAIVFLLFLQVILITTSRVRLLSST